MTMHSSDVSASCRSFYICHEWVYLLFEEFFLEGDVEKEMNLPVTYLCDRDTTSASGA